MRRTDLLQETRKMRFEELYASWTDGHVTQEQAALVLGVCDRTFRRYINRYEEDGLEGLSDKRLTQASHRRAPVDEVMKIADTYRQQHRTMGDVYRSIIPFVIVQLVGMALVMIFPEIALWPPDLFFD